MKFDGQIMNMHAIVYEILLEFGNYKTFDWVYMRGYVWPVSVKQNVDVYLHKAWITAECVTTVD